MPRSLRLERENAVYHLINRGNYRQDLFVNEGTHLAFESCLFEACEKCGWVLEGFCVMTNHFHLVVRTPKGNLVYGMKWLQSTFANRYHRFRKVRGKLFQGRYKSLIVEKSTYLGALLHYVHLNPVRAGICAVKDLSGYRWSSYWYLQHPERRPQFMDLSKSLETAGGLVDSVQGRLNYRDYLAWLSTDDAAQKQMAFDKMCRGWALGSKEFKRNLIEAAGEGEPGAENTRLVSFEGQDLQEANELMWERELERALAVCGKDNHEIKTELKSAPWKVMIACVLKSRSSASNAWIAGIPQAVSLHVGRYRKSGEDQKPVHLEMIQRLTE